MISFQLQDAGLNAMLKRLQSAVGNMQPAMAEIGQALTSNVQLGFKDSKDPWGNKWKAIGQPAVMSRLARQSGSFKKNGKISAKGQRMAMAGFQPLRDTGRLANSITSHATNNSVEVGSAGVKYARMHQFGGTKAAFPKLWGDIPARPFMPIRNNRVDLPAVWQNEVIAIIQRRIAEATR